MTSARRTVLRDHPSAPPMPPPMPILALFDIVGGWWPGVDRRCQRGACGGRMIVVPPGLNPGRLECLSCGRAVAEVVNEIQPAQAIDLTPPRRGRPPNVRTS